MMKLNHCFSFLGQPLAVKSTRTLTLCLLNQTVSYCSEVWSLASRRLTMLERARREYCVTRHLWLSRAVSDTLSRLSQICCLLCVCVCVCVCVCARTSQYFYPLFNWCASVYGELAYRVNETWYHETYSTVHVCIFHFHCVYGTGFLNNAVIDTM